MSKKLVIIIVVQLIILLGLIVMFMVSCNNESNNEIIKCIDSPDGKYTAYHFKRDLGATTEASYQVSILKRDKKLGDSSGNIFIAYGEFDIGWNGSRELVIKCSAIGDVFKNETKYGDITIKYTTATAN